MKRFFVVWNAAMMIRGRWWWGALVGILAMGVTAKPLDHALLVTFGAQAVPDQGDNDHSQTLFIRVAAAETRKLYLRILDPDTGGTLDELFGDWDTTTRFRLLGGALDLEPEYHRASADVVDGGDLLAERTFGQDRLLDGQWVNLAEFDAAQGLPQGDFRLFKLVVDGLAGDDGNVFNVAVSVDGQRNIEPEGLSIFSYLPTVHVPRGSGRLAEVRFFVPAATNRVVLHNFDLELASAWLETPYRKVNTVSSSPSGEWVVDEVELEPWEQGIENAMYMATFPNSVNDATFYVTDEEENPLAFKLPFRLLPRNQRPQPQVSTTVLNDCRTVVYDASQSRDEDDDDLFFTWTFGEETREGNPISYTYSASGPQRAELEVRDGSGVVASRARSEILVTLNEPPQAHIEAPERVAPGQLVRLDASRSTDPDGTIVQYLWDFGDGGRAEGRLVEHIYQQPGYYQARLRLRDDSDSPCGLDTTQFDVWVNAAPQVIAGEDRRASVGEALRFSPQRIYDADSEVTDFYWDFGDGQQAEGPDPLHTYAAPGLYEVTLKVDDGSGTSNSSASDRLKVKVNDPPQPQAGPDQRVAAGDVVSFDGSQSLDPDGQIIAYQWDFGDGQQAAGPKVEHVYSQPGVYQVVLSVRDDSATDSDSRTDTLELIVNHPPIAVAGADQHLQASQIQFDGSGSTDQDGEIIRYHWSFGEGHTGEGVNPSHVYGNPGEYAVTLEVEDDSATASRHASDQLVVRLNAAPVAEPGPPAVVEPGQVVIFDGSRSNDPDGTIHEYHWTFGDGEEAYWARIGHAFAKPGRYQVGLRVKDNSGLKEGVDEAAVTLVVNHPPVAVARVRERVAPGEPVLFDGSASYDPDGEIQYWRWDFPQGGPSVEQAQVTRSFDQPGSYYASLSVNDGQGLANSSAVEQVVVQVNHRPLAHPGEDIHGCESSLHFDGSRSMDGDGDPLTYHWDFGDGHQAQGSRVVHSYQQGGVYPVLLTVDDGQGLENSRHSASLTATVNQPPVADVGEDRTVCSGEVVVFNGARSTDPKGGFLKYHWDFGDGAGGDGVNPTHLYRTGGLYQVRLTLIDDSGLSCGRASDQLLLRVAESPLANAGKDMEVCANTEVTFDGSDSKDTDGLVNSFAWDFGDGSLGGGATPSHMYLEPGDYQVTLNITGDRIGSCDNRDSDSLRVKVHAAPRAVIQGPVAAAKDQPIPFDGSASDGQGATIVSWKWDFGDGNTAEGPQVEHSFSESGRYFVELRVATDSGNQCDSTSQRMVVTVNEPPVAVAGEPVTAAPHQLIRFDASASQDPDGAISHYIWDFGDGHQAEGIQLYHAYQTAGDYQATLRVEDDSGQANGTAEAQRQVSINHPPEPQIEAPSVACVDQPVGFDASGSSDPDGKISRYQWFFGDGNSADEAQTTHTYSRHGDYQVSLEVSDNSGAHNQRATGVHPLRIHRPPLLYANIPTSACPGEQLHFNARNALGADGQLQRIHWDFGDTNEAQGPEVSHSYPEAGEYILSLTADDGSGTACAQTQQQHPLKVNHPPVANAGGDRETWVGGAHDGLWLDASASTDDDHQPLHYYWDFGDGTSASGKRVYHRYALPGDYQAVLKVVDDSGTACDQAEDRIKVQAKLREN